MILGPKVAPIVVRSLPATVAVPIPAEMALGPFPLSALAENPAGGMIDADRLIVDVERPDLPERLWVQSTRVHFDGPGTSLPTLLLAIFTDGAKLDARDSTRVTYTSSDPRVATVDAHGLVMSGAPGRAIVTVTYRVGSQQRQLPIPIVVEVPPVTPSVYTVTFGTARIGVPVTRAVVLTNSRDLPITILSVASESGPDLTQTNNCEKELPAGASCRVVLTFTPTEAGPSEGYLQVSSDANGLPYRIPLSGTGIR